MNLKIQIMSVSKTAVGSVIWLTGIPSSGKTTTARVLENELRTSGLKVQVLDGDEIREKLSPESGFSKEDRELHAKRVAFISHLLSKNGIITIVGLISPFRSFRQYARDLIGNNYFVEVWVKCSLETCIKRDVKGLYKKAFKGSIPNLTGISDPYEPPLNPEVIIDTENQNPKECVREIINYLTKFGV